VHLSNGMERKTPESAPLFLFRYFEREDIQLPVRHIPEGRMRARLLIKGKFASSYLNASLFERQPVLVTVD